MRGFMRRSGTLWFLGTWLGLSALPLAVHADEKEAAPPPRSDRQYAGRSAGRPSGLSRPAGRPAHRRRHGPPPAPIREEPSDAPIQIETTEVEGGVKEGSVLHLRNNVVIRQGDRTVKAQELEYNTTDNSLKADGDVQYEDPIVRASGAGGNYSPTGGASFREAQFELRQRGARGTANLMEMTPEGPHPAQRRELHYVPAR